MQLLKYLKENFFSPGLLCFSVLLSLTGCGGWEYSGPKPPPKTYHVVLCPDLSQEEYAYIDSILSFKLTQLGQILPLADDQVKLTAHFNFANLDSWVSGESQLEWAYLEADKKGLNLKSFDFTELLPHPEGQAVHHESHISMYKNEDGTFTHDLLGWDLSIDFTVDKINFDGSRNAIECEVACKTAEEQNPTLNFGFAQRQCDFSCEGGSSGTYSGVCNEDCNTEESETFEKIAQAANLECQFSNSSSLPPSPTVLQKTFHINPNTGEATPAP